MRRNAGRLPDRSLDLGLARLRLGCLRPEVLVLLGALGLFAACDDRPTLPAGACRLEMLDGENLSRTTLQVEHVDPRHFIVTNGAGSATPQPLEVGFDEAGIADFMGLAVPSATRDDILSDYSELDARQLTFLSVPDHPCTELDRALINFLVMEWFYFG